MKFKKDYKKLEDVIMECKFCLYGQFDCYMSDL